MFVAILCALIGILFELNKIRRGERSTTGNDKLTAGALIVVGLAGLIAEVS